MKIEYGPDSGIQRLKNLRTTKELVAASVVEKGDTKAAEAEIEIPEGLSPDEVDEYLKGLSDEQARQVLARQLKKGKDETSISEVIEEVMEEEAHPADQLFHKLTLGASSVLDQIASFFRPKSKKEGAHFWRAVLNRLSGGRGVSYIAGFSEFLWLPPY